jgi:alanyl aminopeptidase
MAQVVRRELFQITPDVRGKTALVIGALALALTARATVPEAPKLMLGTGVVPQRYRIDLTLTPGADSFHGLAEIDVQVAGATPLVWLNSTDLKISSALFRAGGREIVPVLSAEQHGFIALQFDGPISGAGTLRFEYDGKVSKNSSAGVFALQEDGEWYVYSQFETGDARRAFPCFDQPSFKTPWRITLHVPAAASAFANTPEEGESPESDGMKAVRFSESKPLPSYLVAFAAGHFETVDAGRVGKTPLRVIVPHGHAAGAKFAVEAIPQLLTLEEKYFGRPYPYEKLDSIAMPISNFAMENAGLITYPQDLLLGQAATDTMRRQRECAFVVAHEMAHQWFGDLVTMEWWNDVWLNEAFATWMERKMVGEWKPEWRANVTAVESRLRSMDMDSLVSARRIVQPIESDSDIANAFDDITYEKGAAVLGTFEHFAGTEPFRRGVQAYLKKYEWRTATTPGFLAAVSEGSGVDMTAAFNTFLNQAGVPLVTADLDCSGAKPLLHLSQKRSLPIGAVDPAEHTWQIPVAIRYRDSSGTHGQRILLASGHEDAALADARGCPVWLLGNDEAVGYYRVRYEGGLLDGLLANGGSELNVAERVSELGNVNALVGSGDVQPARALALVPEFSGDPNSEVADQAMEIASRLKGPEVPDNLRPNAARYLRGVFGKRAEALGWHSKADEGDQTRLLRSNLVPFAAAEGDDKTLIDGAESLARQWLKDRSGVEPDMVAPVLSVAAQFGDRGLWELLHQQALVEKDPAIRGRLLSALGSFRDRTLAEASLHLLLTKEFDLRQVFFAFLFGPLAYPETRDLPFDFVRANLDALVAGLPREVDADFAAYLPITGNAFCDATHREEVDSFFRDRIKSYVGGERTLRQALESIDVCIAKKKVLEPSIAEFLKAY